MALYKRVIFRLISDRSFAPILPDERMAVMIFPREDHLTYPKLSY